jgi:REP element-mobilizing transposase RayT
VPVLHKRLPHWERENAGYFVTWRLAGSLPVAFADGFGVADRTLDASEAGPRWLAVPCVAEAVIRVLFAGQDCGRYELGSWVLMANHVHLVLRPARGLAETVGWIKGRSGREANRVLGQSGQVFWARDYFDRWIRGRVEEQRIVRYIERNPVRAGLCGSVEEWLWCSANSRFCGK